eukprot:920078_1
MPSTPVTPHSLTTTMSSEMDQIGISLKETVGRDSRFMETDVEQVLISDPESLSDIDSVSSLENAFNSLNNCWEDVKTQTDPEQRKRGERMSKGVLIVIRR